MKTILQNNKNKIVSTMILILGLIVVVTFSGTSKAETSVIEINSAEDLAKIVIDHNYRISSHYILM